MNPSYHQPQDNPIMQPITPNTTQQNIKAPTPTANHSQTKPKNSLSLPITKPQQLTNSTNQTIRATKKSSPHGSVKAKPHDRAASNNNGGGLKEYVCSVFSLYLLDSVFFFVLWFNLVLIAVFKLLF